MAPFHRWEELLFAPPAPFEDAAPRPPETTRVAAVSASEVLFFRDLLGLPLLLAQSALASDARDGGLTDLRIGGLADWQTADEGQGGLAD